MQTLAASITGVVSVVLSCLVADRGESRRAYYQLPTMSTVAELLRRPDAKDTVLKTVQLDGQVVLKIMQHCDGALPNVVTGQLLGLDVGQTMEVTDCFPFPVSLLNKNDLKPCHSQQQTAAAGVPIKE